MGRMTELQSALLLRRQLAGERRGAGPRSRAAEPLASSRPAPRLGGGGPRGWEPRGSRPAGDAPGPAGEGVGGGDAPQPRPRTGRTPRAAAPLPHGTGALRGRGVGPGRADPPRGADPRLRCGGGRGTSGTSGFPWLAGPARRRVRALSGAGLGEARQTSGPAARGSAELRGRQQKRRRGRPGCRRGAPRARRGVRLRFACLRLARARAAPPVWGRVGAGAEESRSLAGRPGLCARHGSGSFAQARSHRAVARLRLRPGAAAKCLPRGGSVPLPHCPGLWPFAASRLTF